jgi:predicted DNA-binding transcriptional regulator AlpA
MASLKTVCTMYDWKYDTIFKKWKRGDFVQGYRDPTGRSIRFDVAEVDRWAHQEPVKVARPSLLMNDY